MKIIDDWKSVWRYYSAHALVIATIVPVAISQAEQYLGQPFPAWVKYAAAGVILVSGLIGRIVDQSNLP